MLCLQSILVYLLSHLPYFFRIQREQILAKKQEIDVMRAKNSGRKPLQRDGLRPESASVGKKTRRTIKKTQNKQEVFFYR